MIQSFRWKGTAGARCKLTVGRGALIRAAPAAVRQLWHQAAPASPSAQQQLHSNHSREPTGATITLTKGAPRNKGEGKGRLQSPSKQSAHGRHAGLSLPKPVTKSRAAASEEPSHPIRGAGIPAPRAPQRCICTANGRASTAAGTGVRGRAWAGGAGRGEGTSARTPSCSNRKEHKSFSF